MSGGPSDRDGAGVSRDRPFVLAVFGGAALLSTVLVAGGLAPAIPSLPPVLRQAAAHGLAPACHQLPERSLRIEGRPLAVCARCTGLHASGWLAAAGWLAMRTRLRAAQARWWLAAGLVPLALDVLAGTAWPSAWNHAGLRALTGLWAGALVLLATAAAAGESTSAAGEEGARPPWAKCEGSVA